MTTAYTSLLGLALPVTGELSGTWGDTVNNSITSLLDSAIAGTTTLSSDADVTLTSNDGTADTSRQAILLWTAGGTVTRNITAPAQSKIYTVINASSSTQSIVLRGAGPTTGVTIVKGESAVCAWNGSDFIKISNTSGAGVFTTLSVSGAVTLSGGTANGVAYLNGSKVLTTGSALVFDGTNLGLGGTTNSYGSQTTMTLSGTNVSRIDFRSNSVFTGTILSYQAVTEGLRLQTEAGYPIAFYPAGTLRASISAAGVFSTTLGATIQGLTVGLGAGAVATNTAVGSNALAANTSGSNNVAVGYRALSSMTTGNTCVAIGQDALKVSVAGTENTAVGFQSMLSTLTASANSALGLNSLSNNTTGNNNTAIGYAALTANTTASNNTAVG
jgi:hypothetical protein